MTDTPSQEVLEKIGRLLNAIDDTTMDINDDWDKTDEEIRESWRERAARLLASGLVLTREQAERETAAAVAGAWLAAAWACRQRASVYRKTEPLTAHECEQCAVAVEQATPAHARTALAEAVERAVAEHSKHVERFLSELHATMIDPLADGQIKVAEMCKLLLETARQQREEFNDLRTRLAAAETELAKLKG